MTKQSYGDPNKTTVREGLRKLAERNIRGSAENWSVVCFPWGDEDGSYEIEEVYDRLGIPRSNIVGIERDVDKYKRLRELDLGIELFLGEDTDFFEKTKRKFEIVNLDYDGTFNSGVRRTLQLLAGRQLLSETSVLGININGQREQDDAKTNYLRPFLGEETWTRILAESMSHDDYTFPEDVMDRFKQGVKDSGLSQDVVRNEGFSKNLVSILMAGKSALDFNPISKRMPTYNGWKSWIDRYIPDTDESHFIERSLCMSICTIPDTAVLLHFHHPDWFTVSPGVDLIKRAIMYYDRPYFQSQARSYRYTSESGANMLSDLVALVQHPDVLDRYRFLAENIFDESMFEPGYKEELDERTWGVNLNGKKNGSKLVERILESDRKKLETREIPARKNLGSSYRQNLTGQEYYQLRIGRGLSDEQVMEIRRTTPRQLSAYRSHISRGTYGPVPEALEEVPTLSIEYSLQYMLPRKYRKGSEILSDNALLRMEYFIEDLIGLKLNDIQIGQFLKNVKMSEWFKEGNLFDTQVYSFFDDLTVLARNGEIPSEQTIARIYDGVIRERMNPESKYYLNQQEVPQTESNPEKRKLTLELIGQSMMPHILKGEPVSLEEIAHFLDNRQIVAMLMANFIKANPQLGYAGRKNDHNNLVYMKNEPTGPRTLIADSHGVLHPDMASKTFAEQGYR